MFYIYDCLKRIFNLCLLGCVFLSFTVAALDTEQNKLRQVAQLVEYVAVDYVAAVAGGQVIDEDEYNEMVEFSGVIVEQIEQVSRQSAELSGAQTLALKLQAAIKAKQSVENVRAVSTQLRGNLLKLMPQLSLPKKLLPKAHSQALFQANCIACHGVNGQGDGVLAQQLSPTPTDFTDQARAQNRSIVGLYDAISNGINDTAMAAFSQLTEQERWSLAFYVASLAFNNETEQKPTQQNAITLTQMVNLNPTELINELANQNAQANVFWLRAHPEALFSENEDPIGLTRSRLLAARQAHQNGHYSQASDLAISAYLDGFELAENSLNSHDPELRKALEVKLMTLRKQFSSKGNPEQLELSLAATLQQLEQAEKLLNESTLSDVALFSASLVILLREGLEALLVVIALMTVLVKTKRQDALKYVHLGWFSALVAGGLTWLVAQTLINISGASREVMEGVAALLAAVILFYVGIWMHNKSNAVQWKAYIQDNINKRLQTGTLWGLAGLSFIAVYREVFETVLFYQSLITQTASDQYASVFGGFIVGVVILAFVAWALIKFSVKLPIATFFAVTTYLLLLLSFILMGKAISALQEADLVGMTRFPVDIDFVWLGINSTWQGLIGQFMILILFIIFVIRSKQA